MRTQAEKGTAFRELHHRDRAVYIPNPWDAGTARLLEHLGYEALASTSAGICFLSRETGRRGLSRRDDKHVGELAASSDLPVSADLENGYADDPEGAD
jgi:2-methylisocitrate lyase-like PEP mutase family enzyme